MKNTIHHLTAERTITVLLIESHPDIQKHKEIIERIIEKALSPNKARFLEALKYEDAVKMFKHENPTLVIADFKKEKEIESVHSLRRMFPHAQIVLISEMSSLERLRDAGECVNYILLIGTNYLPQLDHFTRSCCV